MSEGTFRGHVGEQKDYLWYHAGATIGNVALLPPPRASHPTAPRTRPAPSPKNAYHGSSRVVDGVPVERIVVGDAPEGAGNVEGSGGGVNGKVIEPRHCR